MSAIAEALLEQLRKLPPLEREEILQQLLRLSPTLAVPTPKPFPTVKVSGGIITSEQVAESLDDE
jgi:hypothetical protein